ncbi:MAG TPA: alpha/beta fold hydrolase [Solirubrobacteraceae bacterium]|nr:alpha/beta fold hydrolase [Solirubrobacteraceae bacterium]
MSPPGLDIGDVLGGIRREIERGAARTRNGINYLAGAEWAPIGPTPSDVVWHEGKAELRHYRGTGPPRLGPPVIALGGLVGRAYIFDLVENNSFVRFMLDAGFDTYVLDWGAPDEQDAANTLDTYLAGYLRRAIRAAMRESGSEEVSIIGYCMGGTLALHGLAAQPDLPVRALVAMAAPVDFRHLGPLVSSLADGRLDPESVLDETGNVPPELLYSFFRIKKPTADLVQYVNLWQNLWNDEYMAGYQALGRCFRDQVPLPGGAWRDIAAQWIRENAFVTGRLRLSGRAVSLDALTLPVLVAIASRDELVPAPSALPLVELLHGTSAELLELQAGHASLTTGRTAAQHTVPRMLGWLAEHSDARSGVAA